MSPGCDAFIQAYWAIRRGEIQAEDLAPTVKVILVNRSTQEAEVDKLLALLEPPEATATEAERYHRIRWTLANALGLPRPLTLEELRVLRAQMRPGGGTPEPILRADAENPSKPAENGGATAQEPV